MSTLRHPNAPVQVIFSDSKGVTSPQEFTITKSTTWSSFLELITTSSSRVASQIPALKIQTQPGQGFTIADGDWYYRIVKPINQASSHFNLQTCAIETVHRVGTERGEWKVLNCAVGFQTMKDRFYHLHGMSDAWAEVQHQAQKDRDEIEAQIVHQDHIQPQSLTQRTAMPPPQQQQQQQQRTMRQRPARTAARHQRPSQTRHTAMAPPPTPYRVSATAPGFSSPIAVDRGQVLTSFSAPTPTGSIKCNSWSYVDGHVVNQEGVPMMFGAVGEDGEDEEIDRAGEEHTGNK